MIRSILVPKLTAAFAFAALIGLAAPAPATATEIGNAHFTLDFPAGWAKFSLGQSDSITVVATKGTEGAYLSGFPHQGDLTAAEIAAKMALYGGNDSMTITEQGTKTLGGMQFSVLEFKQTHPADSSEANQRFRIYYLVQNNFLFQTITVYDVSLNDGVIADLESALTTLKITATVGLRNAAALRRPELRRPDHDILGRFNPAETRRIPLFRLPTR